MKKTLAVLAAALMLLVLIPGCVESGGAPPTGEVLNVYNWGEYIANGDDGSLDVNREFTRRTGIKVNYTTYATNEEMYAKLTNGAADYDVIFPSDYMIEKLISDNMLEKLEFSNIPNYEHIGGDYKDLPFDPANEYSVPYMWGIVGVFYNKSMVDEEDIRGRSWDILWNEKYAGRILMFDNPKDAFGIALKKLGYHQDSVNPDEYHEAYELLALQKPLVQAYVMDQIFDKMANGEAAAAPYYAGDFRIMAEENEDIGFYIPKEGSNFFVDSACVVKDSKHKKAAEMYINFLNDPDIALANSEYICYSTPNTAAYDMLDDEIKNNPFYYPGRDVLDNCDMFRDPPREIYELQNDLWRQLKI
ncbi:MAG: ABC transporter substrate-binding protein [Oscillospiraceae bacterium]|nr:ABC transporter substrate-binding protein [Oscillospiraceae bacterium]